MPHIYRAMRKDNDEFPTVDATGKGLGVRGEPVNGVTDVDLDAAGHVVLNHKGMSVAPAWRELPFFLVSKRLRHLLPAARGSNEMFCFAMGDGSFRDGNVATGLDLKVDKPGHGNIVPQQLATLEHFQANLARTRSSWKIDEE